MDEQIQQDSLIILYFDQGLKYKEIVHVLRNDHDIPISLRYLKRILQKFNLCRRNYSDIRSVIEFIHTQLRTSGQLHGFRMMRSRCQQSGYNVRTNDVRLILNQLDAVEVAYRMRRRLQRRAYFSAGPNFIWHMHGYDKLKPFGLCIHGSICGFSRKIVWLKVYKTNSNPRVIGGYFLQAIEEHGGCPRIVRGDFGTENGHVRAFQTFLRSNHDQDPGNQRPYIDGTSTTNQRIESWWGYFRRENMHFWIEFFKSLQDTGDFNGDFLDKNLMLFCFLALVQDELDSAVEMWNMHSIRPSGNVRVPSGRPNVMYYAPSLWNTVDYICPVSDMDVEICKEEAEFRSLIPCDSDVYEICTDIMRHTNLTPAQNAKEATDLFLYIRREIRALL